MIRAIFYLALTLIFCLSFTGAVFGQSRQMYSWTDENGVVHFADQQPEGEEVTVRDIPDPEPPDTPDVEQQPEADADTSLGQQRREELTQRREEAQDEADQSEAECAAMRTEVERLEPHRRVFFVNEEGETVRMDDIERADRVAEAKAFILSYCN